MLHVSQSDFTYSSLWPLLITTTSSLVAAHQITNHVDSIAETTGCKRLMHKTVALCGLSAKSG